MVVSGTRWAVVAAGLVMAAQAADRTWRGVNTDALSSHAKVNWLDYTGSGVAYTWKPGLPGNVVDPYMVATNASVDGYDIWDGGVPGAGDTAKFMWSAYRTSFPTVSGTQVVERVVLLNGDFSPDHLVHHSAYNAAAVGNIRIGKNLRLQTLSYSSGWTTAVKARLEVASGCSLAMTGANPFMWDGYQGGMNGIIVESGAKLIFDAPEQNLTSINGDYYHSGNDAYYSWGPLGGAGSVEFVATNATIRLGHPGVHATKLMALPMLNLGAQTLRVRSDQTWTNLQQTGMIAMLTRADGTVVESLDGQPLHNLGQVPFYINTGVNGYTMFVGEGTYGAFEFTGYGTSGRDAYLKMTGPVTLAARTVAGGDRVSVEAAPTDFSLRLGGRAVVRTRFDLQGHSLTTAYGVRLFPRNSNVGADRAMIIADNAHLRIGGDLVYTSLTYCAGSTAGETRLVGIQANAGSVITLAGAFRSAVRSPSFPHLHEATVNLVGGSPGSPQRFEAAADPNDTVATATYAIGNLHVGTATEPAVVCVVNESLNDGGTQPGEVLLAGSLSIGPDSVLQVGDANVKVASSLVIDPAGDLDLEDGAELAMGQRVANFWGVGDQAAAWNMAADRVKVSSHPFIRFEAVYDASLDRTVWQVRSLGLGTILTVY